MEDVPFWNFCKNQIILKSLVYKFTRFSNFRYFVLVSSVCQLQVRRLEDTSKGRRFVIIVFQVE